MLTEALELTSHTIVVSSSSSTCQLLSFSGQPGFEAEASFASSCSYPALAVVVFSVPQIQYRTLLAVYNLSLFSLSRSICVAIYSFTIWHRFLCKINIFAVVVTI